MVQQTLRRIACVIVPISLFLVAVIVLLWQFSEITSRQEVLSLTSFLVILTLSALSFNWSRATHTFAADEAREQIYRAGIDLFLASLLALIATCFAWMQSNTSIQSIYRFLPFWLQDIFRGREQVLLYPLFWIHWTFLLLALLLTCGALTSLVRSIPRSNDKM